MFSQCRARYVWWLIYSTATRARQPHGNEKDEASYLSLAV